MAKKSNKLNLNDLTPDERNALNQKVAEYDEQYSSVSDVVNALSTWLGKDVSRHQVYSLRKTYAVEVRKKRNELVAGEAEDALDTIIHDILNHDIVDFADLYEPSVAQKLEQLRKEGKPTWLIKKIVTGGFDHDQVKQVEYYDKVAVAKLAAQLQGRLSEGNRLSVGTLNNVIVKGEDLYANAARQLKAVKVEVTDADV